MYRVDATQTCMTPGLWSGNMTMPTNTNKFVSIASTIIGLVEATCSSSPFLKKLYASPSAALSHVTPVM
jgi:hypothetical protein